jgi:hypothetical protein
VGHFIVIRFLQGTGVIIRLDYTQRKEQLTFLLIIISSHYLLSVVGLPSPFIDHDDTGHSAVTLTSREGYTLVYCFSSAVQYWFVSIVLANVIVVVFVKENTNRYYYQEHRSSRQSLFEEPLLLLRMRGARHRQQYGQRLDEMNAKRQRNSIAPTGGATLEDELPGQAASLVPGCADWTWIIQQHGGECLRDGVYC